ncbi:MAG: hypothetical protein IJJ01_06290 [Firmicutes bacterium]|nr:hypothetical protein [Bacillota bacterium]
MEKQDNRYNNLSSYAKELHENNKKRIKISGFVLILLPIILGLIRWMTDSDKTVFLMIWVLCMFVLSVYLVSVEYLDHVLQKRIKGMSNSEEDYDSLLNGEEIIPDKVKERVRDKLGSDPADEAEKGGDE